HQPLSHAFGDDIDERVQSLISCRVHHLVFTQLSNYSCPQSRSELACQVISQCLPSLSAWQEPLVEHGVSCPNANRDHRTSSNAATHDIESCERPRRLRCRPAHECQSCDRSGMSICPTLPDQL